MDGWMDGLGFFLRLILFSNDCCEFLISCNKGVLYWKNLLSTCTNLIGIKQGIDFIGHI